MVRRPRMSGEGFSPAGDIVSGTIFRPGGERLSGSVRDLPATVDAVRPMMVMDVVLSGMVCNLIMIEYSHFRSNLCATYGMIGGPLV